MKPKLIIFDLDGVLFDSSKLVNDFFMELYPTMTAEIMDKILCGNFHEEIEKFKLVHKKIEETPEEHERKRAVYSDKKSRSPLFGGIKELLEKLHGRGVLIAINTSAFNKNCLPLLENSGIAKFIDFVASAEVSKSKIEKFKVIDEKYKLSKEEMVFVTDTLGDIREADVSHIPTITVTYGAQNRARLTSEKHDNVIGVVDTVEELGRFLL